MNTGVCSCPKIYRRRTISNIRVYQRFAIVCRHMIKFTMFCTFYLIYYDEIASLVCHFIALKNATFKEDNMYDFQYILFLMIPISWNHLCFKRCNIVFSAKYPLPPHHADSFMFKIVINYSKLKITLFMCRRWQHVTHDWCCYRWWISSKASSYLSLN